VNHCNDANENKSGVVNRGMSTSLASKGGGMKRIDAVDLLRGFAMLLLALDLVRYYTFDSGQINPVNLDQTTAPLFFARWVTHFFAPLFLLLAGTSAYLRMKQGMTVKSRSFFLATRGLLLIALEVLVVGFLWKFQFNIYPVYFQFIWVTGLSMIVLAGLVWLPVSAIAGVSLAVIFGHNLLDTVSFGEGWWQNIAWGVLHQETAICLDICKHSSREVYYAFISYPLIPWFAVMGLGYSLGALYEMDAERRKKFLLLGGLAATVLFILVRAFNGYGNPKPWSGQDNALWTVMSFLNTEKYPPSLAYLLMTLGPALMLLALFEQAKMKVLSFVRTIGRVPVFSYLVYFLFAHTMSLIIGITQGYPAAKFLTVPWRFPEGFGLGLGWVLVVWVGTILVLYPICDWYAGLRERKPDSLIRYL